MEKRQKVTNREKAVGKKIKQARERIDISQEDLAVKTHLTQTFISLLETGKRKASMKTLEKIARALNVRVNELIPF